jgi:hypothetical protein
MDTNTNKSEAYLAQARRENIAAVMRGRALTVAAMKAAKREKIKPQVHLNRPFDSLALALQ